MPYGRSPLFQTTPSVLRPAIGAFCVGIGGPPPVFVPVVAAPGALPGRCCFNVATAMARHGGSEVFGWTVWEGPLFLTAEFHANWSPAEGELLDITPKPDGERTALFSPDPAHRPGYDFTRRPDSRTLRTYSAPRDVEGAIARMSPRQLAYRAKRAARAGLTVAGSVAAKLRGDARERDVDEYVALDGRAQALLRPRFEGLVCADIAAYRRRTCRMVTIMRRIERVWAARQEAAR